MTNNISQLRGILGVSNRTYSRQYPPTMRVGALESKKEETSVFVSCEAIQFPSCCGCITFSNFKIKLTGIPTDTAIIDEIVKYINERIDNHSSYSQAIIITANTQTHLEDALVRLGWTNGNQIVNRNTGNLITTWIKDIEGDGEDDDDWDNED